MRTIGHSAKRQAPKRSIRQKLFRLALAVALCLALFAAGCKGSVAVYPYNKEQAGLSEQGGEYWNTRPQPAPQPTATPWPTATPSPTPSPVPTPSPDPTPTPTPQPTPTPLPVLTRDEAWKIPDSYGYQDETGTPYKDYYYRDLRGDYPMPDTVEVELTTEQRQALEDFFAVHPALVERIGTHNYASIRWDPVLLMDLTGDGAPEILIPYTPLEIYDCRPIGGVIEVYELFSGRYLGRLYTSDRPKNCIGWYRSADGRATLYVLGYQNFVDGDPTSLSGGVHHFSHILWRVEYDGRTLQSTPLWFYDTAYWPAGFVETEYHISLLSPDPAEMAAYSCDPYTHFNHIFDLAQQGADPMIPRTLRQLEPVRTEYAVYQYDFPPAVWTEWDGTTSSSPRYWGQSDSMPQTSFPLGLQLGYYLCGSIGYETRNDPPPKAIADRLDDPLPEEPPEPADGSPFVEWDFRWKQTQEEDGNLVYYKVQEILFSTPPRINHIFGVSYLLWQAVPEGEGWRLTPLWLYVMAPESDSMAKNGVDLRDFTVLRPSLEDAVAFALDPAGQYEAMRRRGTAGDDPAIYEDVARLRPVPIAWNKKRPSGHGPKHTL